MATMEKEIQINKAGANLFYEQCMGSHNGQMASVPNNPVLNSICRSHGVNSKIEFAQFLKKVAEHLENEKF